MRCVRCSNVLSGRMVREDGMLECPECGAVYRRKSVSPPSAAGGDRGAPHAARPERARAAAVSPAPDRVYEEEEDEADEGLRRALPIVLLVTVILLCLSVGSFLLARSLREPDGSSLTGGRGLLSSLRGGESAPKESAARIPVSADLTAADVEGELFRFKGRTADGGEGWGVMNAAGKVIIEPYFAAILDYNGSCFPVTLDGVSWGFIDKYGQRLSNDRYQEVSGPDRHGFYRVREGEAWGLCQPAAARTVPCRYEALGQVDENGLFPAKRQGLWGVADLDGNTRVDYRYSDMSAGLVNGLIGVSVNGAWGVVDTAGSEIIRPDSAWTGAELLPTGLIYLKGPAGSLCKRDGTRLFDDLLSCEELSGGRLLLRQSAANKSRALLTDGEGKTLLDSEQLKAMFLNASTELTLEPLGDSGALLCRIPGYVLPLSGDGKPTLSDWVPVSVGPASLTLALSEDGSRFYVSEPTGSGGDTAGTRVYSLAEGREIAGHAYHMDRAADLQYGELLVFTDSGGQAALVTDLDGNVQYRYKTADKRALGNQRCVILSDGSYYGVLTGQGFVGNGVSYLSAACDEDARTFTLTGGGGEELYRLNPDGTTARLS